MFCSPALIQLSCESADTSVYHDHASRYLLEPVLCYHACGGRSISFDTVHVQEEFERYGVGAIPSSWWREPQPLQELDWRYRNDENWKTFRGLITKNDSVCAFRSPNRPWSSYDMRCCSD
ncbi:MAG: hypothetical protein QM758_14000 [Armatimonas sp.]